MNWVGWQKATYSEFPLAENLTVQIQWGSFSLRVYPCLCVSLSLSVSLPLSMYSHFYQCRYVCTIYLKLHFDNFKLCSTSSFSYEYENSWKYLSTISILEKDNLCN